jgi:hypothetical protein
VLHIEMRRWADIIVVAPASANLIAKAANGISDNFVLSVIRAWDFSKPCVMCPAMNTAMWIHPSTKESLTKLQSWGWDVLGPVVKRLACNDRGNGAMVSVPDIKAYVTAKLALVAAQSGQLLNDSSLASDRGAGSLAGSPGNANGSQASPLPGLTDANLHLNSLLMKYNSGDVDMKSIGSESVAKRQGKSTATAAAAATAATAADASSAVEGTIITEATAGEGSSRTVAAQGLPTGSSAITTATAVPYTSAATASANTGSPSAKNKEKSKEDQKGKGAAAKAVSTSQAITSMSPTQQFLATLGFGFGVGLGLICANFVLKGLFLPAVEQWWPFPSSVPLKAENMSTLAASAARNGSKLTSK